MTAARALAALVVAAAVAVVPGAAPAREAGVIDLDVVGADVRDVIRLLADVGHVNVVCGDGVSGTVTVRLKAVPWRRALDAILAMKGLTVEEEGNVLVVVRR